MANENWKDYWSKQKDPRHSVNQDGFFQEIAKEIAFHLGDLKGKKILEIGCGDGSILKFLSIEATQYLGIDFSDSLLEKFEKNHPDYKTINIGGIEYLQNSNEKYDVIFSFGVLQYFDKSQLKELFSLQKRRLNPNGIAFHFGIPIAENKKLFTSGKGIQSKTMFKARPFAKQLKSSYSNNIGNWHNLELLCHLSQQSELHPHIYGGIHYLYRVNLLQKN